MSVDLTWDFLRVTPDEVVQVQEAFEKAVKQSQIAAKAQAFFCSQEGKPNDIDSFDSNGELIFDLFYPDAFTELYNDIATGKLLLTEQRSEQVPLGFVFTNRVGAAVMLFYSLGWSLARRLPGYFGNIFAPPNDVANTLTAMERIFEEVNTEEFIERAEDVGSWGNCNEDVAMNLASLLPAALRTVLAEGNGLLALNYPDVGSIPYSGCEGNEYEGDR